MLYGLYTVFSQSCKLEERNVFFSCHKASKVFQSSIEKSSHKWTHAVQTRVVQASTVYSFGLLSICLHNKVRFLDHRGIVCFLHLHSQHLEQCLAHRKHSRKSYKTNESSTADALPHLSLTTTLTSWQSNLAKVNHRATKCRSGTQTQFYGSRTPTCYLTLYYLSERNQCFYILRKTLGNNIIGRSHTSQNSSDLPWLIY